MLYKIYLNKLIWNNLIVLWFFYCSSTVHTVCDFESNKSIIQWVIDCCLTPIQYFMDKQMYIMARTSHYWYDDVDALLCNLIKTYFIVQIKQMNQTQVFTTGVPNGTWTSNPLWTPWVDPCIEWGSCCSIFSFLYNVLWIVFCTFSFSHYIVCPSIYSFWLYPFGIFKLFLVWFKIHNNKYT